jgi:hypothetical protein
MPGPAIFGRDETDVNFLAIFPEIGKRFKNIAGKIEPHARFGIHIDATGVINKLPIGHSH